MDSEQLFRQIDEAESRVLGRWDRWLQDAEDSIPWTEIERLAKSPGGQEKLERLPSVIQPDNWALGMILAEHGAEMVAAGRAHGDLLVRDLARRFGKSKLADLPTFSYEAGMDPRLIPEEAINVMETRAIVLSGDVSVQLEANVKSAMIRFLYGTSRPETEQRIEDILQDTRDRASLITTTESTYAYNRGRLASFAENEVDYVRFSAVMDSRTSPQCRSRHGKIMRLDDPRLQDNTPPLHGRCRSVLDPLYSAYQPELLTEENLNWNKAAPLPNGWSA